MKIRTHEWESNCGDGCCYNWGVTLYIDDVEYEDQTFSSVEQALEFVLSEMLGHSVDKVYADGLEDLR